jgi:hypothetical protein
VSDGVRGALTGGACGIGLLFWALVAAGSGHGSYLPFGLAAAPVSSLYRFGVLLAPILWAVIGYALARRSAGVAIVLLATHVGGAVMTLIFGTPAESSGQQWEQLGAPWAFVVVWPGFAVYLTGLVVAIRIALAQLFSSDETPSSVPEGDNP